MATSDEGRAKGKPPATVSASDMQSRIDSSREAASQGNKQQALDALLAAEKQCRLAEDMACSRDVCVAIVDLCHKFGTWQELIDHITLITKRRGQLKSTIQAVVRRGAELVDEATSDEDRVALVTALRVVTEGKIAVELERARLTRRLASIHEARGDVAAAADAMQEVAVETYGAMHRREKIAYVLEQMRLCMDAGDFTRSQILSRKVSPRAFAKNARGQEAGEISLQGTAIEAPVGGTPEMAELKARYYSQLIRFHKHSDGYLEIVRCLLALYDDAKGGEPDAWVPILKQVVWYLVLCPTFSTAEGSASDYVTLRSTVSADAHLADLPEYAALLAVFTTSEVAGIPPLLARYGTEMDAQDDIFGGDAGARRRKDFAARVTEHNILVIARYYTRLRMPRLAALLGLPAADAEARLCELVVKDAVDARIERPAGIVTFRRGGDEGEGVLDAWGSDIAKLLGLVESASKKIQKESMQHGVPIGSGA